MKNIVLIIAMFLGYQLYGEGWYVYQNFDDVNKIYKDASGQGIWLATSGGVANYKDGVWKTYTTADGLAGSYVTGIVADSSHRIWCATNGGLNCFDGEKWTHVAISAEYNENFFSLLDIDSKNNLWTTNWNNLYKYGGGEWTSYAIPLPYGIVVRDLDVDKQDNVWILGNYGPYKWNGSTWTNFNNINWAPYKDFSDMDIDSKGNVWILNDSCLMKYDGVSWSEKVIMAKGTMSGPAAISIDKADNIWIEAGQNLFLYNGLSLTPQFIFSQELLSYVKTMFADETGKVWLGTWYRDGMVEFNNDSLISHKITNTLSANNLNCVSKGPGQSIWLGSDMGVSILKNGTWSSMDMDSGLPSDYIEDILLDDSSNMWIGTNMQGAAKYSGDSLTLYNSANGLAGNELHCIFKDQQGDLWFGLLNDGISKYNHTNWRTYNVSDGLVNHSVLCINQDASGNMWFGTEGGISVFNGSTWTNYTVIDGITIETVHSIAFDSKGNAWIGTNYGVFKFNGTDWQHFPLLNSTDVWVPAIAIDNKDQVWAGTWGYGLFILDADKIYQLSTYDGLCDVNISDLLISEDTVWITTLRGLTLFIGNIHSYIPVNQYISDNHPLNIFPNPAYNQITIDIPASVQITNTIIYSITGEVVYQSSRPIGNIEIDNLSPGWYGVQLITSEGLYTASFIKH
jgi:ligand-binding sensor domain-containing protein